MIKQQLNNQLMQVEEGNNTCGMQELNLTGDQLLYLNSLIPKGFLLVPSSRPPKEGRDAGKGKNLKTFVEEESRDDLSKSQKNILDKSIPEIKRQRTNKSSISIKQDKAIPRSAYVFEEAISAEMKPCMKLLQQIKKHQSSWPFLQPVDPIKLDIPTYFDIIKEPIDLGTIYNNLRAKHYQTPIQFHADISKMFMNSYRFNHKGSEVYLATKLLQQYYNRLVEEPDAPINNPPIYPPQRFETPKPNLKRQHTADYQSQKVIKKRKPVQVTIPPLTLAEKKQLGQNIRKLPRDSLKGVWEIVNHGNNSSEQLKFDIDQLPVHKARELEIYVNRELSRNLGTDYAQKETMQTSESMVKGHQEESEDASSFLVSEDSN